MEILNIGYRKISNTLTVIYILRLESTGIYSYSIELTGKVLVYFDNLLQTDPYIKLKDALTKMLARFRSHKFVIYRNKYKHNPVKSIKLNKYVYPYVFNAKFHSNKNSVKTKLTEIL